MAFNNLLRHDALSRNTLWNIISQVLPSIVALIAIPYLIKGLGHDRFGLLTICWMISGYFSLLDFGIGRALTQLIASKVQSTENDQISHIIKTALVATLGLSAILTLVLILIKNLIIYTVLKIPAELQHETQLAIIILAFSLPLMIFSSSLKGILESIQRFDLVNVVRAPATALSFVLPVLTLSFSNELHWSLASLLFFRLLTVVFYWYFCIRLFPSLKSWSHVSNYLHWNTLQPLLKFGGWMTVSNIISPIMVQMDRLFIGNILTISAVAYYTTPYEMVSKLLILPGAISSVLFPALATITSSRDSQKTSDLLDIGVRTITMYVLPAVLLIVLFAREGLTIWLGAEMASHSVLLTQILALGFLFVSIAHAPFALLQAVGRPDLTAKIHLFELVIYIPVLIFLTKNYGIEGTATAWCIRAIIDLMTLSLLAQSQLKTSVRKSLILAGSTAALSFALLYSITYMNLSLRAILAVAIVAISLLIYKNLSNHQKIFSLKL